MNSNKPLVAKRKGADDELNALLAEIVEWPDTMLVHMHKRFGTSRLFRVHHDPEGPLTQHAAILLDAARAEMESRGLSESVEDEGSTA